MVCCLFRPDEQNPFAVVHVQVVPTTTARRWRKEIPVFEEDSCRAANLTVSLGGIPVISNSDRSV